MTWEPSTRVPVLPMLSREQVRHLAEPFLDELRRAACNHLIRLLPRGFADAEQLETMVAGAMERAWSFRLMVYDDVIRYLALTAVLGENFESRRPYVQPCRFLQRPDWPSLGLMAHVMNSIIRSLDQDSQEALMLERIAGALQKPSPHHSGPIAFTGDYRSTPAPSVKVDILQGNELFYSVTPGVSRPMLELHAVAAPEGGMFRWEVEGPYPVVLTEDGARAWIRPRKPGEARVRVSYYNNGRKAVAHARLTVKPAARIRVTPDPGHIGTVALGEMSHPLTVTICNIGGSPLNMGHIQAPAGFTITNDRVSRACLQPDCKATLKLVFEPHTAGCFQTELLLPSDAANDHEGRIELWSEAFWPEPFLEWSATADGPPVDHVSIGLWDGAWNPKNGALYNLDKRDFISRDNHCFYLRLTDHWAAAHGHKSVEAAWWTRRDGDRADENKPRDASVTLTRVGRTALYVSHALMVVVDETDYRHVIQNAGKKSKTGCKHHLRLLTVDESDGLDRHVTAHYQRSDPENQVTVWAEAPVFARNPDLRRRVCVQIINVRIAPDGKGVAGEEAILTWQQNIRSVFARWGVSVSFEQFEVDPPVDCRDWPRRMVSARDAGVEAAFEVRTARGLQWVPSPSQLQLIDTCCPHQDRVYLFMVQGIYNPLKPSFIEGEVFNEAVTGVPDDPAEVCRVLNQQITARALAARLCPEARPFRGNGWTQTRRNRLGKALDEALAVAGEKDHRQPGASAQIFMDALDQMEQGNSNQPKYIAEAITAAREDIYPVFYKPATLGAMMEAARGCMFLAQPDLVSPYRAAHFLGRILLNGCGEFGNNRQQQKSGNRTPAGMQGLIEARELIRSHSRISRSNTAHVTGQSPVNRSSNTNPKGMNTSPGHALIRENAQFTRPYSD